MTSAVTRSSSSVPPEVYPTEPHNLAGTMPPAPAPALTTTVHHDHAPPQLGVSAALSLPHADLRAMGLAMPPDADTLLRASLDAQREQRDRFLVRHDAFIEEQRVKSLRLEMLKRQQRRREAWMAMDADAVVETVEMLEVMGLAVRDRLTSLRPDGYRAFVFHNGDTYEGSWKNCKMHGKGVLRRCALKDVYEGQWFGGQRSGIGSYHCPTFSFFYNGAWLDNRHHGKGELVEPEGTFAGEFADNIIQGYGEYRYQDGHVFKGEWVRGVYEGTGSYHYPSGARYEGQWEGGLEHGRGTMLYANGDVYTGDWRSGYPHGSGVYERRGAGPSGAALRVEGAWYFGSVHGEATGTFADGSTYTGQWACDRFDGHGSLQGPPQPRERAPAWPARASPSTAQNADGGGAGTEATNSSTAVTYTGDFRRGLREGFGTYRSDVVTYTGHWQRGAKSGGPGVITTRGCGALRIDWAGDVPCGEGVYVPRTGQKQPVVGLAFPSTLPSGAEANARRVDARLEAVQWYTSECQPSLPAEPLD